MPNRFQINQHRLAYSFIASRDGDHCLICKASPDKTKLQIDHADNNPSNWDPLNLHLLCQAHNLLFRGVPVAEKLRIIEEHSDKNERDRETRYGSISSKVAKDMVDYRAGSEEMKANSIFEPVYTEWLLRNLPMTKDEAIHSGALIAGCSPLTSGRYLKKLACAAGPLQEFRNGMNVPTIDFKPDLKQPADAGREPEKLPGNSKPEHTAGSNAPEETVTEKKGYRFKPPKGEIRN
ncbi:MAG: hypothetical protein ABSB31_05495 [Dehalococcoidia bacterium]